MDNQTTQLDPQVVALAKAIRQSESGGNPNAVGKSGEYGAYQFTEPTWNAASLKYLGQIVPLKETTLEQQNEVAYKQIKEWKDKGFNVGQVASMWNAGEGEPDAYTGKFSNGNPSTGTGVRFDVPSYATRVANAYQTLKGGGEVSPDVNNPSSVMPEEQPQPEQTQETGGYKPTFAVGEDAGLGELLAKTVGNIPGSTASFAKGVVDTLNPVNTINTIGQIPGAFKESVKEVGLGDTIKYTIANLPKTAYETLIPVWLRDLFKGDVKEAAKAVAEDPTGQLLPVALGFRAVAEKAGIVKPIDTAIEKGVINPIKKVTEKVGEAVKEPVKFVAGQTVGKQPSTISETIKNPSEFTRGAIKNAEEARNTLGTEIKTALDERIGQLSETGKQYGEFRASKTPIKVDSGFLRQQIEQATGLTFEQATNAVGIVDEFGNPIQTGPGRFVGNTTAPIYKTVDINKLNKFYNDWQPTFESGVMSPTEFLNMRSQLADLSKYEGGIGKSMPLDNSAKGMRKALNDEYRSQIPGLENIDMSFEAQKTSLKDLRKGILDKEGNLTSGAVNKIANATGKGKTALLSKLEEIRPGITKEIGIVKALEDWQGGGVGTYARGGVAIGGFALGGPIGGIISMIMTSPEIVVPALRAFGKLRNIAVEGIIKKLVNAVALAPNELKIFVGAMNNISQEKKATEYPTSAFTIPVTEQNKEEIVADVQQEPGYTVDEGKLSVVAPNGKVYTFKNKKALDAFRAEAGL